VRHIVDTPSSPAFDGTDAVLHAGNVTDAQVAVLGGGISGCMTACLLADQGIRVIIVEQQDTLVSGASLWNDGKIHLGYTFTGTPSLSTARLMQDGAAVFLPTLERVTGSPLASDAFGRPVMYIVDRGSMVDPDVLWGRAEAIAGLLQDSVAQRPGLAAFAAGRDLLVRVPPDRATEMTGQGGLAAAWLTTELHCSTRVIAEDLRSAVRARDITVLRGRVTGVQAHGDIWRVTMAGHHTLDVQVVVNSTWENRTVIDRYVQQVGAPVSIRYKYGVFGRAVRSLDHITPSTRILGRFGDITTYPNGDAYLSWYPAGLAARSDDGCPPAIPPMDASRITAETLAGLGMHASVLEDAGATWQIHGGYVVAHGHGDIDRVDSLLHERDRPRVTELRPGFLSVDTGKYTLGPLMACHATAAALRHLGRDRGPGQASTAP